MKSVLKYIISPDCVIDMPRNSEILAVQAQKEVPCLWALCEEGKELDGRRFMIFGTGHPLPRDLDLRYVGTFQLSDGKFVFHVFEDRDFPFRVRQ